MNSTRNLLILPIALFLSIGIGTASIYPNYLFEAFACFGLILIYISIGLFTKNTTDQRFVLFFGALLCGYLLYAQKLPNNQKNHIENLYNLDKNEKLIIEFTKVLRPTSYYQQYIAKVIQIEQTKTKGKVLVRIPLQDSLTVYEPGQRKLIYTTIRPIPAPSNPFDIDFRSYYRSLDIFHQMTLNKNMILKNIDSKIDYSWLLQKKCLIALDNVEMRNHSKQLIQAMVLGYRNEWATERSMQYSDAGVAHILAISGLHVGVLYLVLYWLISPLQQIFYTRIPAYLLCLVGLWCYAWLTGHSPSVIRSVSMLSFFVIAKIINRPAPSLHTLGSSYIVLLIIKPEWLFHIGFQMSYSAVFFILWLYPLIHKLWNPKNLIVRRIFQMISITIIAQLGVLPWTLHYFGKFPGLFLLSNLIVLSQVSLLLIGGMIILIISLFGVYKGFHIKIYEFITQQIDQYVLWVSQQESWVISIRKPNLAISIGIFILLLTLLPFWWRRGYLYLKNFALASLTFILMLCITKIKYAKEKVWLLQQIGESSILRTQHTNITLYTNNQQIDTTYMWKQLHNNYVRHTVFTHSLPSYFIIDQQPYLIINKASIYPVNIPNGTIIILQQSTSLSLDRLIQEIQPRKVIADGSNFPSSISEWKRICQKTKTPFKHTGEKGAVLLATNNAFIPFRKFLQKPSDTHSTLQQ